MSTPIETNTEQLQEVLQQVYNLPSRSGGSTTPDLVIGLNANGNSYFYIFEHAEISSFSILSGSVANVIEKIRQGVRPVVLLKLRQGYDGYNFSDEIAEATHVSAMNATDFDATDNPVYSGITASFFVQRLPEWSFAWGCSIFVKVVEDRGVIEMKLFEGGNTEPTRHVWDE